MKSIIFSLFANNSLVETIQKKNNYELGEAVLHQFPDEETYVRINSQVRDREIIFVASLDRPNPKFLPLVFAAKTAVDLGAKNVGLIAPYLPYMRQDKQFNPGEGITSNYFAELISNCFNWLITIDPHLHRHSSLNQIYSISTSVLHATGPISQWIKEHINHSLLIGPDQESEQWVEDIAQRINAPYVVLEKIREGDTKVSVSIPHLEKYQDRTFVLVDDIISTGKTMLETIKHLKEKNVSSPIYCLAVHAVFSSNAYQDLLTAGVKVVTCNTIPHVSNAIDVGGILADSMIK